MTEADSGSGAVSLFPVSNKLQARMYVLEEAIENQKFEVMGIGQEMRRLIEKKENEIIKELDSIWDEANARIDREKEDVQKKFDEIEKRNIEMKKNYDEMNQILEQMDQKLLPLPQISEAVNSAKSELNISIPYLNLFWGVDELRESINRMCRVEQVFREEDAPFTSQLDQAEIGMNEPSRKDERVRKLEMKLDEWRNRNRILEESMNTVDSENEILKRDVDRLEVLLARTKQASTQEVGELKLSLVKAKKEIEVLRAETKERLKQSEQLEQERRKQDLEKLRQAQTEVESSERAASGNKEIGLNTMYILGEHTDEYGDAMKDLSEYKDDQFSSQIPLHLSMKADMAESKTSKTEKPLMLKDGAESETLEEKRHTIPTVIPKVFRQQNDAIGDEIERYKADVLTIFLNKTYSLTYNTSTIKTTNLSHLKVPDSHLGKQVLVKIKGQLRLGNLKVVFSKMHVYLKRKEMMAGILLQEPVGTSNGVYESTRHFDCPDNHAVFVLISDVYVPLI